MPPDRPPRPVGGGRRPGVRSAGGASKAFRSTPLDCQLSRKTSLAQMSQFSMPGVSRGVGEAPLVLQVQQLAGLVLGEDSSRVPGRLASIRMRQ